MWVGAAVVTILELTHLLHVLIKSSVLIMWMIDLTLKITEENIGVRL